MKAGEQPARAVIIVANCEPERRLANDLRTLGIAVQWAGSINAASDLVHCSHSGTVVFTELALIDGNWRDLVERVRDTAKPIPIVLLSSSRTAELWWDALECGVEDILQAPISVSQLCNYLAKEYRP